MKKYKYTAVDLYGKKFRGTFLAENEKDLRSQLSKQSLFLVRAKLTTDKSPSRFFSTTGKITPNELSTFCRQFAILVTSGTSIIDSLNILKNQSYTGYLKKVLQLVYEDVKAGKLLSEALQRHKKAFPNFFLSMVRIGEISGKISEVLVASADYLEADAKVKAKTKSALAYPIVLIVLALALIVLMVGLIIPTFQTALAALEVEMPPITLVLFAIGQGFQKHWKLIFIIAAAIVALFLIFIHTKYGRLFWDKFKYHVPYVKNVIRNNVAARFCRAFSLLVSSGMDIVDAMDEVVIVLGNAYVARQFKRATENVRQGMTLTMALQGYKLFPDMLVQMVAVGENTNQLDTVLGRACPFFENQVERALVALTGFIQPVMLIIIGAAVGLLFYAVYSPMLQVMNGLNSYDVPDVDDVSWAVRQIGTEVLHIAKTLF